MTSNVDATLAERGSRYGEFADHARITQNLKRAMVDSPKWAALSDDKKEALEMTVHKIGRILNGDPEYIDSWHDIIGYIRLVERNLEAAQTLSNSKAEPVDLSIGAIEANILEAMTPGRIVFEPGPLLKGDADPLTWPYSMEAAEMASRAMTATDHYCAAKSKMEPGHAVECQACKTAIYGPREL